MEKTVNSRKSQTYFLFYISDFRDKTVTQERGSVFPRTCSKRNENVFSLESPKTTAYMRPYPSS